jgi:SpoVK/Ycf46/Vps4 family AAA+-type ATPase
LIADPGFTHFWLQACGYSKGPKVLLIEDAETLLMTRGPDNGHWVGNLLNLTDGIMGDNMRFQIICTINCPLDAIDPALLRPGRLAASWIFRRLDRERAQKLANIVGKQLPEGSSFALSDIYGALVQGEAHHRPEIGFGVRG